MPPPYANLSKNATIPSVNGGILWEDSVNKRLYLYGGEFYQSSPPTGYTLYSYDILHDDWMSLGPPKGSDTIMPTSYGAGVSISWIGEAYYYGGWVSGSSVAGWTGPPQASNRLIKYTMDSNTWSNLTGPDNIRRAEGTMVYIPIGDAGMLIYFGGAQDLFGNGTLTPQPLDEIFIYDVSNTKWYTQKTSGRAPENRRRFCGGATWAQDQSSYNM
jgi:Galactose oxidase, central domain